MTPIARLSRVERPSLQHYETARRKALEAVDAPDELPEALREMRVARAMLPRSAGPVVGWIDELLPLPDRGQPARTSPASTDVVWQKLARIDLTAGAVSVVASGVALTGLALWLTAALASGLGPRGALAILGAGLLVVGLVSLYLARRLVSYGAEHTGGAFRRWAGIEVCFGLAAAGAGAGGVLSLAGDGGGQQVAVLWSAAGILAAAIVHLLAVAAGLVLGARPAALRAAPGALELRDNLLLRRAGAARHPQAPLSLKQQAEDERLDLAEQVRMLREEVGRVAGRQSAVARRWRSAYFWLSMPAAALAGAAGVVGVTASGTPSADQGWWIAGLALAAAALTALSAALNPGRHWEAARQSAGRSESLHRELTVMHNVDLPGYAERKRAREAIEYVLARLDGAAGVTGESFWRQQRRGEGSDR